MLTKRKMKVGRRLRRTPCYRPVRRSSAEAISFNAVAGTEFSGPSPAGAGTVDVTVTTPGGTSATGAADLFTYAAPAVVHAVVPQTGSPTVTTEPSTVQSNISAALAGTVNPQGLPTMAHFEYGLDSKYTNPGSSEPIYDHTTPDQTVGPDFTAHNVSTQLARDSYRTRSTTPVS